MKSKIFYKKFVLIIFAVIILCVSAACGSGDSKDKQGGNPAPEGVEAEPAELFSYEDEDGGKNICLTGYSGTKTKVNIPDKIDEKPVTGISETCFEAGIIEEVYFSAALKSFRFGGNLDKDFEGELIIPHGVTEIVVTAFYECKYLTRIVIPDSVTKIGDGAFYQCAALTNVTIPESVTSIGERLFMGCYSLTDIVIPEGAKAIKVAVFYDCRALTSVTIPESVTTIDMYAFYDCRSLVNITLPDSVKVIDKSAFTGCASLSEESKEKIMLINPDAQF